MPALLKQATLSDVLVRRGTLTKAQLLPYQRESSQDNPRLSEALLADGLLTEPQLAEALAEQHGLPYHDLTGFRVDFAGFTDIAPEWMTRYGFVPLYVEDGLLLVAISNPRDLPLLDRIEKVLERPLRFVVAAKTAIHESVQASERSNRAITKVQNEFRPVLVHENELRMAPAHHEAQ